MTQSKLISATFKGKFKRQLVFQDNSSLRNIFINNIAFSVEYLKHLQIGKTYNIDIDFDINTNYNNLFVTKKGHNPSYRDLNKHNSTYFNKKFLDNPKTL